MGKTNAQHARDAAIIDVWVYAHWTSDETQADIARSMGCNNQRIGQRVAWSCSPAPHPRRLSVPCLPFAAAPPHPRPVHRMLGPAHRPVPPVGLGSRPSGPV